MRVLPTLFAVLFIVLAGTVRADAPPAHGLRGWIAERVTRARDVVERDADGEADDAPAPGEEWRLHRFSVNVKAGVGFEIHGVGDARVSPEIELMFERDDEE